MTAAFVTVWLVLGVFLNKEKEPTTVELLISIGGLFLITITTMIEAKNAQKINPSLQLKNNSKQSQKKEKEVSSDNPKKKQLSI